MSPSLVSPHLVSSSRLVHRLVISFPRPAACLARRHPSPSSHRSSLAICLLAALRPASRLVLRPVPLGGCHRRPTRSLPRAVRLAVIDCPALLVGWLGAGRDGTPLSPSPARFAAAACPGWRLACVRFLVAVCSACLRAAVCVCIVMAKLYI